MEQNQSVDDRGTVTSLLRELRNGDAEVLNRLMPLVYTEMARVARSQLRREREPRTLNTSALVHEAYLRMSGESDLDAEDRSHFLGIASRVMRQILIDEARKRQAVKRGGSWVRTTVTGGKLGMEVQLDDLLDLDRALARLGEVDEQLKTIVECRFFGGMTDDEIARWLGVSDRSVRRGWVRARAWLYRELYVEKRPQGAHGR